MVHLSRTRALLASALALLLLASPVRLLWAHASRGWWVPFAVWGGVLLLTRWAVRAPGGPDA